MAHYGAPECDNCGKTMKLVRVGETVAWAHFETEKVVCDES